MYTAHAGILRPACLFVLAMTGACCLDTGVQSRSMSRPQSCDLSCPAHETEIEIQFYSDGRPFTPTEALVLPIYNHHWAVPMEGGPPPLRASALVTYLADPLLWRRGKRLVLECPALDIVNCRVYGDRLERCLIMVPGFAVKAIDRTAMRARPATSSPCREVGQPAHVTVRIDLQRDASAEATRACWRKALLEADGVLDEHQLLTDANDVMGSGEVFLRMTAAGRRLVDEYLPRGSQSRPAPSSGRE